MDDAASRVRESLYTAVGFGVLGFQQAAVEARAARKELSRLATEVDARIDPLLDDLEAGMADDVRPLLAHARSAARSVQRTLLGPPPVVRPR